jgi:hypothetical protein
VSSQHAKPLPQLKSDELSPPAYILDGWAIAGAYASRVLEMTAREGCSMRMVIVRHETDEHQSLDCILCEEDTASREFTVSVFHDEETGGSFVLCPEHLNDVVEIALKRHRDGLKEGDPFWYLTPDKDPWEDVADWKEASK